MLKSKKHVKEQEWLEVYKNIENYISKEHVDKLTDKTKKAIKERIKGKKTAVSWSGGKDSIILEGLCSNIGIKNWFIALTKLEYPDFLDYLKENSPPGLDKVVVDLDLEWLSKNKEMLFPDNAKVLGKWYRIVQHKVQRQYCQENDIDILILGRRKKDGNFIGKNNEYIKNGTVYYTPVADWTHEEVFGFLHYNGYKLPKIYEYRDGFRNGTHVWPSRERKVSILDTWREIFEIDQSIVKEASKYFEEAKEVIR